MQNHGEERWLTYAEAADLLGISPEAVRQRARRYKWPRRTPNEHGAVARVMIPDDDRGTDRAGVRLRPALNGGRPGYDRGTGEAQPPGHERPDIARTVRETVELLVEPLREQLDIANQRAARAEQETRDLRHQLSDATAAERIAREEAAGLRAELDARQQWGLRRRLRWALGRRR